MSEPPRRRYIIVVHGIGEQKINETTTPVVHRFAEVRSKDNGRPRKNDQLFKHLLPASLSGQSVRREGTGHGWSEFNGIPVDPDGKTGPFDGTHATDTSGLNFRFVDLHWADILQEQQPRFGSPTEVWAEALLYRLAQAPGGWMPEWASRLLKMLVHTALPVKRIMSFYKPRVADLIFNSFLGDVHLYGDYPRTRGKAVRRFHVILDEIVIRDFIRWYDFDCQRTPTYHPPVFTIIAHSLGSILSFDALVYSRATWTVREKDVPQADRNPSLPFPGYTEAAKGEEGTWDNLMKEFQRIGQEELASKPIKLNSESRVNLDQVGLGRLLQNGRDSFPRVPPLRWRDHIAGFVTLGSPIDKYHVLWYQNYLHMGLRRPQAHREAASPFRSFPDFEKVFDATWMDQNIGRKIVHYNLCDEQDPVGHHLDVARSSKVYPEIFESSSITKEGDPRDVVFRRYGVPGVAHVKYWEDQELFERLLVEVIDRLGATGATHPAAASQVASQTEGSHQKGRFLEQAFWEKDGAYAKGQVWAYFRIPFVTALVTFGLLIYGFNDVIEQMEMADGNHQNWWALLKMAVVEATWEIDRVVALMTATALWACPNPMKAYEHESSQDPKHSQNVLVSGWNRVRPRRSIFSHLVAGGVEWRAALKQLAQRDVRTSPDAPNFKTAGLLKHGWWRVLLLGVGPLGGSLYWLGWPPNVPAVWGLLWGATYLGVMTYVFVAYASARPSRTGEKAPNGASTT